jgi:hypothetical protein
VILALAGKLDATAKPFEENSRHQATSVHTGKDGPMCLERSYSAVFDLAGFSSLLSTYGSRDEAIKGV